MATTMSPRKNVLDVGIELGADCMPSGFSFDQATVPALKLQVSDECQWLGQTKIYVCFRFHPQKK